MWNNQPSNITIHGGFPNPAADRSLAGLDLHKLLIRHPASTFFMQVEGSEWEERGIFAGDIAVIDRSLRPRPADLAIVIRDDSFLIIPAAKPPPGSLCWGVVTAVIHQFYAQTGLNSQTKFKNMETR